MARCDPTSWPSSGERREECLDMVGAWGRLGESFTTLQCHGERIPIKASASLAPTYGKNLRWVQPTHPMTLAHAWSLAGVLCSMYDRTCDLYIKTVSAPQWNFVGRRNASSFHLHCATTSLAAPFRLNIVTYRAQIYETCRVRACTKSARVCFLSQGQTSPDLLCPTLANAIDAATTRS